MSAVFMRLTSTADKGTSLFEAVLKANSRAEAAETYKLHPCEFAALPGSPFSYWISPGIRQAFVRHAPFESSERRVRAGLQTSDDGRFLRLWWETHPGWPQFVKGGRATPFHSPTPWIINYTSDGLELKAWINVVEKGGHWSRAIRSDSEYLNAGMTWPLRARCFAPQAMPAGAVFSVRGYSAFVPEAERSALLALCSSSPFDYLFKASLGRTGFPEFVVGVFQSVPWPAMTPADRGALSDLAHRAWSLRRSLDTISETSHAFHLPALLEGHGVTLGDRVATWSAHVAAVKSELVTIQDEIDDIAFGLYGIEGEDRARIEAQSGTAPVAATDEEVPESPEDDDPEEADESDTPSGDTTTLATELASWSIGVAFGRFDIRHATGELPPPVEPGPFDPLPARSPGMCPDDALAVEFLVDDPGHALDLSARVADVFAKVFPADHEARLDEAVRLAGSPDFQSFLRRTFFAFHLKRYSRSRRKAPIWWPLSTASGGYTVWLAWPRLTRDTLFRVADELKRQKLPFETRKLTSLKQDAGPNPSTREKATIAGQEDFVSELSALLEEVERVAPLWNPVHDDGVSLHFALLWRVVRDAAWQKECRAAWDKLAKGDYDWAHVAMHLWPERVAPKCRTDRSLAIAHGLEDSFWVEVAGKWQSRPNTDAALAAAVAERSSPAVKASLRALESAPVPSRGGRGRRAA